VLLRFTEELLLLPPGRPRTDEHVHGAGSRGAESGGLEGCAHDDRVTRDRDRPAEAVARGAVGWVELLLLAPRHARAHEHVDGSLRVVIRTGVGVSERRDDGRVP